MVESSLSIRSCFASHEMMAKGVTHRCAASGGPCAAQGHRATAHAARCTADCPNREGRQMAEARGLKHPRSAALVRVLVRREWLSACANEGIDGQLTTRPSIWSTLQHQACAGTLIWSSLCAKRHVTPHCSRELGRMSVMNRKMPNVSPYITRQQV